MSTIVHGKSTRARNRLLGMSEFHQRNVLCLVDKKINEIKKERKRERGKKKTWSKVIFSPVSV